MDSKNLESYKIFILLIIQLGKLETSTPWLCPPPLSNVNEWLKDFRKLDFGGLKAYIGGKYMIDPNNTNGMYDIKH